MTLFTSERKILIENVTNERAKWRLKIKELADALTNAVNKGDSSAVTSVRMQLALNMNPFDKEDQAILETVDKLVERADDSDATLMEVNERLSLLLKHDWDRAKHEANPWLGRGSSPRRVTYCEYKCSPITISPVTNVSICRLSMVWYFFMMMFAAGVLFFLVVGMKDPFEQLVRLFNDPTKTKTMNDWMMFIGWSLYVGIIWATFHLGFKWSEEKLIGFWSPERRVQG